MGDVKFTPGHWYAERQGHNRRIWSTDADGERNEFLAEVEREGDFMLFMAARELLDALIEVSKRYGPLSEDGKMAREAIAKATGQ